MVVVIHCGVAIHSAVAIHSISSRLEKRRMKNEKEKEQEVVSPKILIGDAYSLHCPSVEKE